MGNTDIAGEDSTKGTVQIDNENYYITVGKTFAVATVPRENDVSMNKTRVLVETICKEISRLMEFNLAKEYAKCLKSAANGQKSEKST